LLPLSYPPISILFPYTTLFRSNPVNVNIEAANKKSTPVFNTPARNAQAVTELLIGNLISFYRNIISSNKWIREDNWKETNTRPYLKFRGNEVAGRTVGFVGFGAVGQTTANSLKKFPADIQFYDHFVDVDEVEHRYKKVDLDVLFRTSDVISIHLPVNDSTKNLVNKDL